MPLAQFDGGWWIIGQNGKIAGAIYVHREGSLTATHFCTDFWVLFTTVPSGYSSTHVVFDRSPGSTNTVISEGTNAPTSWTEFVTKLDDWAGDGFEFVVDTQTHFVYV